MLLLNHEAEVQLFVIYLFSIIKIKTQQSKCNDKKNRALDDAAVVLSEIIQVPTCLHYNIAT